MLFLFNVNLLAQIEDTTNVPAGPTYAQTPTYANIAGPENVLVVYKSRDSVSTAIANYYMSARNIPAENKIGLNIPDSAVYDKGYGNYTVKLIQSGEVIYGGDTPAQNINIPYSWYYYEDYIHLPIENYLKTTQDSGGTALADKIRFIVTCKGIPLKVQFHAFYPGSWHNRTDIAVDPLICL
jgi:hypothetical protein